MTLESGETYDHLIFPERAQTYDGYAVYLDGNHGLLEITNPEAPGGTLLVFKDSFANCLLPLLAADNASNTLVVSAAPAASGLSELDTPAAVSVAAISPAAVSANTMLASRAMSVLSGSGKR